MISAKTKRARQRENQAFEKALGARMLARRRALSLDQEAVAREIGASPSTLSRYENGLTSCEPAMLARVAKALKCNVSDLVDGIAVGNGK